MKNKTRKKTIAFSLGLAMAILSATSVQAQGILGDLLDEYYAEKDQQSNNSGGVMGRGTVTVGVDRTGQGSGATYGDITGQTFGENTPLGSGLFVLLAAGAGYASMKSRKKQNKQNKQNRKEC
jgi:hypothetical protein